MSRGRPQWGATFSIHKVERRDDENSKGTGADPESTDPVNTRNEWASLCEQFHLPNGCVNSGVGLKQIYLSLAPSLAFSFTEGRRLQAVKVLINSSLTTAFPVTPLVDQVMLIDAECGEHVTPAGSYSHQEFTGATNSSSTSSTL
ncbi:hypothetical protein K0M31_014665 [Melipona bicolor]|uniref:Uncharacterized protein n=1 Tax=Melipona bicolor TaxID=60889 RepID=A0AA40FH09_9HYME|nr:hypothetical protein K0M31_014665 [Melipona bicolor]